MLNSPGCDLTAAGANKQGFVMSQFETRFAAANRGRTLEIHGDSGTYNADGTTSTISAVFYETLTDIVDEKMTVQRVREATLLVSSADVPTPSPNKDTWTINGETWSVNRVKSRKAGMITLVLRLKAEAARRREGIRQGI